MDHENLGKIVALGESSVLKEDLNQGVASLFRAESTMCRPHVCLNGEEGFEVIKQISENPKEANTEFELIACPSIYNDQFWLNIGFAVFLNDLWSNHSVCLTPQQTSLIVSGLDEESRATIVEITKRWFEEKFLPGVKKGLKMVSNQFESGDALLASDRHNHIFDLHGGRATNDIPYTERRIAGAELFSTIIYGGTFFEHGADGYERADRLIEAIRSRQKEAIKAIKILFGTEAE